MQIRYKVAIVHCYVTMNVNGCINHVNGFSSPFAVCAGLHNTISQKTYIHSARSQPRAQFPWDICVNLWKKLQKGREKKM